MSTQKDPKTGKWNVQYWYTDWTGKRKHSVKRGFNTKRDADEWLSSFQNRKGSKLNISFGDFVEIYFEDMEVVDFFVITTSLSEANILKPTKEVER